MIFSGGKKIVHLLKIFHKFAKKSRYDKKTT